MTSKEISTTPVSGKVIQLIPPDEHDAYAISPDAKASAAGDYIAVVETQPNVDRGLLDKLKHVLRGFEPPETVYTVAVPTTADISEGEYVTLGLKVTETPGLYEAVWGEVENVE